MAQGVGDGLFNGKMAIGAIYRAELAQGLGELGYGIDQSHAAGRFEIAGVLPEVIDAVSTRRAEIEAPTTDRAIRNSKDKRRSRQRHACQNCFIAWKQAKGLL